MTDREKNHGIEILNRNYTDYLRNYNATRQPKNPDKTELLSIVKKCDSDLSNFPNIIIYGREKTGKYSEALNIINHVCPIVGSEKHVSITSIKSEYVLKFSNIHYEIDMSLLGCNAKSLWQEIFTAIQDIVKHSSIKYLNNGDATLGTANIQDRHKQGIILCKNFHNINPELLEIFYSYIQTDIFAESKLRFIILTEHYSFLPSSIQNAAYLFRCSFSSKTHIERAKKNAMLIPYRAICDTIVNTIRNYENTTIDSAFFIKLRADLYDLLVLNINIHTAVYYIISKVYEIYSTKLHNDANDKSMNDILNITYHFLRKYNNNYRPIYHLESFILNIIKIVHS